MFRGGLRDLIGGGKMDVAVGEIDRRAGELARAFGCLPRGGGADFVDRLGPGRGSHRQRSSTKIYSFTPAVVPGRTNGASPESMNTVGEAFSRPAFMDSGFAASRRPGMTGCVD